MQRRLPAYSLITIDPLFSIWSMNDKINEGKTKHWISKNAPISGFLEIDNVPYRFLGDENNVTIPQISNKVEPLFNTYVFENDLAKLSIVFWSPFIMDNLDLFSTPISFIEYTVEPKKDIKNFNIKLFFDKYLVSYKKSKITMEVLNGKTMSMIGKTIQKPLAYSGDSVSADWGYLYFAGKNTTHTILENSVCVETSSNVKKGFISIFYDDVYSIEFFHTKCKGYWTEKFKDAKTAINYFIENYDSVKNLTTEFENKLIADMEGFSDDYKFILKASYRQVCAAHKLIKDPNGNLQYISKECHSNGCMQTVDVTYPSTPLFFIYNPELVRGMMDGIMYFAKSNKWNYPFAPHDLGQYPLANGQVYGLKRINIFARWKNKKEGNTLYMYDDKHMYNYDAQMPVEECGNLLTLCYTYSKITKNYDFINEYYGVLKDWAEYLIAKGTVLERQLCTDDFAGHLEKNVNLAIKGTFGIYSFALIADIVKKDDSKKYLKAAKEYAGIIETYTNSNGALVLNIGNKESWSIKYNLVWDVLFNSKLFSKNIIEKELAQYDKVQNKYGVPLDSRASFTKSDWLIWVSILDESGKATEKYAKALADFLENTSDRMAFSDWYDTISARRISFDHRTVQGGLWMPILKKKFNV